MAELTIRKDFRRCGAQKVLPDGAACALIRRKAENRTKSSPVVKMRGAWIGGYPRWASF